MQSTGLLIPTKHRWDFKLMVIIAALMTTMGATAQQSIQHEPVPMPGSELRRFHSKIMDQDLLVYVQLPLDYVSDGSKQYPVMYMTDGNRSFPIVCKYLHDTGISSLRISTGHSSRDCV